MNVDLSSISIKDAREGLEKGSWSAVDLYQASKRTIEAKKELNAFLEVFTDGEEQAKHADGRIKKGEKGS